MAGAGYKLFNTGDVLTAAQVNTYLQEQAVMRFANATARTSALSGVLAEGMVSYLDDTNAMEVYNGSAWVGVGSSGDIEGVTAGTGISGGGTSGTVTITNSMATAIDAKGDLIVGTGADTFSRLAVGGTNGHVLTVDSGESTGMKWAAASSTSALTFIKSVTVGSGVASVAVTSAFSATYANYMIVVNGIDAASDDSSLTLTFGAISTGYYGTRYYDKAIDATTVTTRTNNGSSLPCGVISTTNDAAIIMYIYQPNATERTLFTSQFAAGQFGGYASGITTSTTAVTDFTLACGSNMTGGTIRVYGIANS